MGRKRGGGGGLSRAPSTSQDDEVQVVEGLNQRAENPISNYERLIEAGLLGG